MFARFGLVLVLVATAIGAASARVKDPATADHRQFTGQTKCGTYSTDEEANLADREPFRESNATSTGSASDRISHGYDARPGQYPAFAMLMNPSGKQFCGATLIDDRHLLTAGQCIADEAPIMARLGVTEFRDQAPIYQAKKYCYIKRKRRPGTRGAADDIGIIELHKPVRFTDRVKPAQLPSKALANGQQAHVVGFGVIDSSLTIPAVLQVLPVKRDKCPSDVDRGLVCLRASHPKHKGATCYGDSGSGVFAGQTLQAIVEGGEDIYCANLGPKSKWFVNVHQFRDWIETSLDEMSKLD